MSDFVWQFRPFATTQNSQYMVSQSVFRSHHQPSKVGFLVLDRMLKRNRIGDVLAMQRPKSLLTMLFACSSSTSLFHQPMLLSRPPEYFTTKTLSPKPTTPHSARTGITRSSSSTTPSLRTSSGRVWIAIGLHVPVIVSYVHGTRM